MKNDMYELSERLYDFAQIPNFSGVIEDLKNIVEEEDWTYHNTSTTSTYLLHQNQTK